MTGHHPWSALLERTFTPEERAAIVAEGAKIADDNRRRERERLADHRRGGAARRGDSAPELGERERPRRP